VQHTPTQDLIERDGAWQTKATGTGTGQFIEVRPNVLDFWGQTGGGGSLLQFLSHLFIRLTEVGRFTGLTVVHFQVKVNGLFGVLEEAAN